MRLRYLSVIACILAAMFAAGCTESNQSYVITVPGSSLLHIYNITWYEYRIDNTSLADQYGTYDTVYYKYQFDNVSDNGTIVPHELMVQRYGVLHNFTNFDDRYWDSTGNVMTHEHSVELIDGKVVWSGDAGSVNISYSSPRDNLQIGGSAYFYNFTSAGKESLSINGTAYECDKYRSINIPGGQDYFIWVDPAVPVPVKISAEGGSDNNSTVELMGWG